MSFSSKLVDKLRERIESGVLMVGAGYLNKWVTERYARKYFKEYGELGTGLGVSVLGDALGIKAKIGAYDRYLDMLMDGMSDYGFLKSLLEYKIEKEPFCYFKDTNTIRCINFDVDKLSDSNGTYVTVQIDGASVTVSGVSGSPTDFEISLGSPTTEGWHKLLVTAGDTKKDSFSSKKSYARS